MARLALHFDTACYKPYFKHLPGNGRKPPEPKDKNGTIWHRSGAHLRRGSGAPRGKRPRNSAAPWRNAHRRTAPDWLKSDSERRRFLAWLRASAEARGAARHLPPARGRRLVGCSVQDELSWLAQAVKPGAMVRPRGPNFAQASAPLDSRIFPASAHPAFRPRFPPHCLHWTPLSGPLARPSGSIKVAGQRALSRIARGFSLRGEVRNCVAVPWAKLACRRASSSLREGSALAMRRCRGHAPGQVSLHETILIPRCEPVLAVAPWIFALHTVSSGRLRVLGLCQNYRLSRRAPAFA